MKKRINIDISESLWRRVGVEAAMRGIAKRELVEQALESYIKENQGGSEMMRVYKLDVYVASNFDEIENIDEASWELVETIECETEEMCYEQANTKYDQENYHWTNPYLS